MIFIFFQIGKQSPTFIVHIQFYGTVITETDTLHIEPLLQLGPVVTTNKVTITAHLNLINFTLFYF